jgi:hypothetical protein
VALPPDLRSSTEWLHLNMNEAPLSEGLIYNWVLEQIKQQFIEVHRGMDFESGTAWQAVFAADLTLQR